MSSYLVKGHVQQVRDVQGVTTAWRAVVTHPTEVSASGGAKRLSKQFAVGHGRTSASAKRSAHAWLDDIRSALRDGQSLHRKAPLTLSGAAEVWLSVIAVEGEQGRGRLRDSTLDYYTRNVRNFIHAPPAGVVEIGLLRLDQIDPSRVSSWVRQCISAVSRDAAKRALMILKAIFRLAVTEKWIAISPAAEVKLGSNRDDDGHIDILLQRDHVRWILRTAKELAECGWVDYPPETGAQRKAAANRRRSWCKWYPLLRLGFASGARTGELLAARRYDFDLESRTFRVQRTVSFKGKIERPKTVRGNRTLALDTDSFAVVQARLATIAEAPDTYLFGTSKGKPDNRSNLRRAWDKLLIMTNARMPRNLAPLLTAEGTSVTSPYHCRHYHASELLNQGIVLQDVSERLGHADTVITQRHYAHLLGDRSAASRTAADVFGAALRNSDDDEDFGRSRDLFTGDPHHGSLPMSL